MIVLEIRREVVRLVRTCDIGGIGDMAPVDTRREAYTRFPSLRELVVHISVIGQLRARRCVIRQERHHIRQRIVHLSDRTGIAKAVLDEVDTVGDCAHPVFIGDRYSDVLEGHEQRIFEVQACVHISLDITYIVAHLLQIKTGCSPFDEFLGRDRR